MAVSLDPWRHGQRGTESGEQIARRVFGNFRRHMWPILGQTTLDSRVVDWAMADLHAGPEVVAGGVSMGGDVAVALAGIDNRITRVAAIVATPDWTRPGMTGLFDPYRVLPQGQADAYAQWFHDQLGSTDPSPRLRTRPGDHLRVRRRRHPCAARYAALGAGVHHAVVLRVVGVDLPAEQIAVEPRERVKVRPAISNHTTGAAMCVPPVSGALTSAASCPGATQSCRGFEPIQDSSPPFSSLACRAGAFPGPVSMP